MTGKKSSSRPPAPPSPPVPELPQLGDEDGPFVGEGGHPPPGPYLTAPHDVFAFLMRESPGRIAALLPEGLRPLPGLNDSWLLVFHDGVRKYPETTGEASVPAVNEATVLIPCLGPRLRPAVYIPAFYTRGLFSLLTAREVHGLPGRFGRVERTGEEQHRFELTVNGTNVATASWQAQSPFDVASWLGWPLTQVGDLVTSTWSRVRALGLAGPRAALSSIPLFVHKRRARDVSRGPDAWAVDQLVQLPLHLSGFDGLKALAAPRVELGRSIDGLRGSCFAGMSARVGVSWGAARDRLDYRK